MATLLVSREFFYRTHKAGGVKLLILRVEQGAHRLPADPTKYAGLTRLDLVFMDTTSLYFEGAGGQTLGQHGFSKDHRPDLRQMILAVLIDGDGRPVCSEMWPGNTADVTSLIPVIDRLRRRFAIGQICIVADRGMISAETLAELETRELFYILGVRERSDKVVRELVLNDPGPFVPLVLGLDPGITKRRKESDYGAKAVMLGSQRYIAIPAFLIVLTNQATGHLAFVMAWQRPDGIVARTALAMILAFVGFPWALG